VIERDGYPPGVPCWIDTSQPDPEAAVRFYQGLFGWEFTDRMPPGSEGSYYVARLHGMQVAAVGSQPEGSPPTANWATSIWVESADETAAKAKEAGGSVLAEPFDIFDAGRMAVLSDPTGAVFSLWQAGTHRGAELVNEANTWNWSDLNTRDAQVAKAFYGAVFGWVAEEVDLGDLGEATMLRRPGYGDFLEQLEPDIRSRQTEAGAPPGFADAIGWMSKMSPDQFPEDVPSHWSVTFAVEDVDAIAATAERLGGRVLIAPFDAGAARIAVLADPQGAVFNVSKYQALPIGETDSATES
jgi:uncharacterized protein